MQIFLTEFCPSRYALNLVHTHVDNSSHNYSQTNSLLKGKTGRITVSEQPVNKEYTCKSKISMERPFIPLFAIK
jgi:hypothetical protein